MRNYLVTATLTLAFVTPDFAKSVYVPKNRTSGPWVMMTSTPSTYHFKVMGRFKTVHKAKKAMSGMSECAA